MSRKKRIVVISVVLALILIITGILFTPIKFLPIEYSSISVDTRKGEGIDIIEKMADDLNVKISAYEYDHKDLYILEAETKNIITILKVGKYLEYDPIIKIVYPWQLKAKSPFSHWM